MKKAYLLPAALLFLITFLLFMRLGGYAEISLDDSAYVFNNPYLRQGLTWDSVYWALTTNYFTNWAPITWLSHLLTVEFFGFNPGAHHLVSVGLHLCSVLLLFILLCKLQVKTLPSFFIALIFGIHPLSVEAVAWISSRKDLLATFFGLLTIYFYKDHLEKNKVKSLLFYLFFCASLAAKPVCLTLPALLILLDYWPLKRKESLLILIKEKIFIFFLAGLYALIQVKVYQGANFVITIDQESLSNRIISTAAIYFDYLYRFFIPLKLSIYYPKPDSNLYSFIFLLKSSALLLLLTLGICLKKRQPAILVGILWFFISLLPFIQIVPVGIQSTADRWVYFPQIGLIIALICLFVSLLNKKRYLILSLSIISLLLGVQTNKQISAWKNGITIFDHSIENFPDSYMLRHLAQTALKRAKQPNHQKIINNYIEALEIKWDFFVAFEGLVEYQADHPYLKQYLLNPELTNFNLKYTEEYYYRAKILNKILSIPELQNHVKKHHQINVLQTALKHLNLAIQKRPDFHRALNLRAILYIRQGKLREAESDLLKVFTEKKTPEPATTLAYLYAEQKKYSQAEDILIQSKQYWPHSPKLLTELAKVQIMLNKHTEAKKNAEQSFFIDNSNIDTHLIMAVLLQKTNPERGKEHLQFILTRQPQNQKAQQLMNIYNRNQQS